MGKVTVFTSVTLDGIMQAPGRPDEDTRGGFRYGGWALPYNDPVDGRGRRRRHGPRRRHSPRPSNVLGLRGFWPKQEDNPFTDALNKTQKYVTSTTLKEPLPWANSTPLKGDVPAAVATLKAQAHADMVVLGSGELVQALMKHALVDTYMLLIDPLVLGTGRRLFAEGTSMATLRLVDTKTTTTGVVIATYQPA